MDTPEENTEKSEAPVEEPTPGKLEAVKNLWKAFRTPIIVGASAVAGALIYARATAESDDDEDLTLPILDVTEADPTE